MTVQIALCDDETAELNKTEKILDAYEQKHTDADFIIERFKKADELLYMVREGKYLPHLIFMNVYMPGFVTWGTGQNWFFLLLQKSMHWMPLR